MCILPLYVPLGNVVARGKLFPAVPQRSFDAVLLFSGGMSCFPGDPDGELIPGAIVP